MFVVVRIYNLTSGEMLFEIKKYFKQHFDTKEVFQQQPQKEVLFFFSTTTTK